MRGFGQERDRVREVSAHGLDDREASENHQRNEESALADVVRVAVRAVAVAVPMPMPMRIFMFMPMFMDRMDAVICVMVMVVGVRHEPGTL